VTTPSKDVSIYVRVCAYCRHTRHGQHTCPKRPLTGKPLSAQGRSRIEKSAVLANAVVVIKSSCRHVCETVRSKYPIQLQLYIGTTSLVLRSTMGFQAPTYMTCRYLLSSAYTYIFSTLAVALRTLTGAFIRDLALVASRMCTLDNCRHRTVYIYIRRSILVVIFRSGYIIMAVYYRSYAKTPGGCKTDL
jgi:hypothetical protein